MCIYMCVCVCVLSRKPCLSPVFQRDVQTDWDVKTWLTSMVYSQKQLSLIKKQSDTPPPIVFISCFAATSSRKFQEWDISFLLYLKPWAFELTHSKAKGKTFYPLVQDLFDANNTDVLFIHSYLYMSLSMSVCVCDEKKSTRVRNVTTLFDFIIFCVQ